MFFYLLCWIIITCTQSIIAKFETLDQLLLYTKTYPEYPRSDDENWLNPKFTSFYKSMELNALEKLLFKLNIITKIWTPADAISLLEDVLKTREEAHLTGRTVARIRPSENSKIFIWGDIHGSLHSMARDLEFLHKENLISKDLKITNNNHYFIFNGDSIDRSPYSLETLTVLTQILKNNPNQVIMIRGQHENKGHWYNFGLKEELRFRLADLSKELVPFGEIINKFFDTLPLALYISTEQNPKELIRISHFSREYSEIDERQMGNFFSRKQEAAIIYHDLKIIEETTTDVDVKIIIETENWRKEKRASKGLGLLNQDLGAITWAILSSPIMVNRKYLNFHYDAFAAINIAFPLSLSTITLFNQDIDKIHEGFKQHPSLYLQTGSDIRPDPSKPDFIIGSSLSLIGGIPIAGQRIKRGISILINSINKKGGIKGHLLRLIAYNDNYNPQSARKNILKLMEKDKSDVILLPIGSPTLSAYLDLVKDDKILVLFPATGAPQFRSPELVGLIHYRASYADEAEALATFFIKSLDSRKFSLFFQNDAFGIGPMKATQQILQSYKLEKADEIPYHRATTDFSIQSEKIKLSQADTIGLFSTALPTIELLRTIGIQEVINKKLFGVSFLGEESIRDYAKAHGLDIVFGAVVPDPWTSQYEIVDRYRTAMMEYNYPLDVFSLEAFIGTSILIDVLENIDEPFSKNKIKQYLESLDNYRFHDLILSFDPKHRDLARHVWIENENWIEFELDTKKE